MSDEWTRRSRYGIWAIGERLEARGYGVSDIGYRVSDIGYGIWDTGYGIWATIYNSSNWYIHIKTIAEGHSAIF
jgi:hypothetical protein